MFLLQILNPNPEAMSKMIEENASEEFLHSLSNYCALQVREPLFSEKQKYTLHVSLECMEASTLRLELFRFNPYSS